MCDNGIEVYEMLCNRLQHMEKTMITIVIILVSLTGVCLKKDFIQIATGGELAVLFLPFAVLAGLYYGLALRLLIIAGDIAAVEAESASFTRYPIRYFSSPSLARKLTFVFFNAQAAAPFLFVPMMLAGKCDTKHCAALLVPIILMIVLFSWVLIRKTFVDFQGE